MEQCPNSSARAMESRNLRAWSSTIAATFTSPTTRTMCFSKGTLYITDSHHGKLFVYRANEELRTIAAFAGQLQNIHGVTTDDAGNIFISIQTDLKSKRGDIIELSKERS